MKNDLDALHQTQRLRYEAFSNFAKDLHSCKDYAEISKVLTSQIKFILDCFIFRIYFRYQQSALFFHGFKGNDIFFQTGDEKRYLFEDKIIKGGMPVSFSAADAGFEDIFHDTIFAHQKVTGILALPIEYADNQNILITIASKEQEGFIDIDFKFLKLIGDMLSSKLSQLLLLDSISKKNSELQIKNKQITSLNKYLENAVSARTAELMETNTELSKLLYSATHDFRAPLANIMGIANLAQIITDDAEVLSLFERCRAVVNGMDAMLSKLDHLNSAATTIERKMAYIDLETTLNNLTEKHKDRINKTGAAITTNLQPIRPLILPTGILITIFEHLLDNALTFCTEKPQISIEIFNADDMLIINFNDEGMGINELVTPKIFDMYYRGHALSKGNGLGLYIVRKLLKTLNGTISVNSKEGRYSKFTIQISYSG